jgi:hypothetical protein
LAPALFITAALALAFLAPLRGSQFGTDVFACTSFAYQCTAPTVTGVSPIGGPITGGTTVTITGTQFNNTGLVVHFGATLGTSVMIVSDNQITIVAPAHAAGQVDVTVTTTAGTSATNANDKFTFGTCQSVTGSAAPPSPSTTGTSVTFTGAAAGCPNPLYEFWILPPGGTWTLARAYSTIATFNWSTAGPLPAGLYYFGIWARDALSSGASCNSLGCNDTFVAMTYTLQSTPCTGLTGSAAPASPQPPGTSVTFTGVATGCGSTPLYQFWMLAPGSSTWTSVQAYSTSASFIWSTTGLAGGLYHFAVWVRDTSSTGSSCNSLGCNDAFVGVNYTLTMTTCTSVTASASPTSPQLAGTPVTFTGVASGCPSPLYEFWILPPGSSTWTVARAYSSTATFNWSTAGPLPAGLYHFSVWVRDASSAGMSCNSLGCLDAFVALNYTLTSTPCTSVTASASPASPQPAGTPVTFTGVASGCPSPLYEFWILTPGSSTWTVARAYSSTATFNWSTAGPLPAGLYHFSVWVRDASSSGMSCNSLGCLDAFVALNYTLTSTPCTSVTAAAAPPTTSPAGTAVVFTGVATGCGNTPMYQFWILVPGSSTWVIAQGYSTSATFNWTTTGLPAGVYQFSVWVRDSSSSGTNTTSLGNYDAFVGINHTLT